MFNILGINQLKRYDKNDLFLSIIKDNNMYEFGLSHPLYNDNQLILIGRYGYFIQALNQFNYYLDLLSAGKYPISINGYIRKGLNNHGLYPNDYQEDHQEGIK